jgi:hypothetical protein
MQDYVSRNEVYETNGKIYAAGLQNHEDILSELKNQPSCK